MDFEDYKNCLPAGRAARWKEIGIVTPLAHWRKIATDNEGSTWDMVVECDASITKEQGQVIIGLGYYGHKVKIVHGTWISQGHFWESKQKGKFVLTLSGPEGSSERIFTDLDDAEEYIQARIQWCNSQIGNSFNTDFINYQLTGFTLQDIGINPEKWTP